MKIVNFRHRMSTFWNLLVMTTVVTLLLTIALVRWFAPTPAFACGGGGSVVGPPIRTMNITTSGSAASGGTMTFAILNRDTPPAPLLVGSTSVAAGEQGGTVARRLAESLEQDRIDRENQGNPSPFPAVSFVGTDTRGRIVVENPDLAPHNCSVEGDSEALILEAGVTNRGTVLGLLFELFIGVGGTTTFFGDDSNSQAQLSQDTGPSASGIVASAAGVIGALTALVVSGYYVRRRWSAKAKETR